MNTKKTGTFFSLLFSFCACTSVPEHIRTVRGVRLIAPENDASYVLSSAEAGGLLATLDGRLFTPGARLSEEQRERKTLVLTVAYPCTAAVAIVSDAKGRKIGRADLGSGETHLHVFSDGSVGYMKTMKTYHVYPMRAYCAKAVQLAREHGLLRVEKRGSE